MTTKDEALRVAREALGEIEWSNDSKWQSDRARSALRTIALAVEGSAAKQDRAEGGSGQEVPRG